MTGVQTCALPISNWWTTIVIGLFAIEAVVFTVQANNEAYLKCPELQGQYMEMMQKHVAENLPACPGIVMEKVEEPCCGGCSEDKGECCGKCEGEKSGDCCSQAAQDCCGGCTQNEENTNN